MRAMLVVPSSNQDLSFVDRSKYEGNSGTRLWLALISNLKSLPSNVQTLKVLDLQLGVKSFYNKARLAPVSIIKLIPPTCTVDVGTESAVRSRMVC